MRADIEREMNRAWFANPNLKYTCGNCGQYINNEAREAHNSGFTHGATWAIRRTTEFSPHVNKLIELITWLAVQDSTFKEKMIELMFDDDMSAALKRVVLGEVVGASVSEET